MRYPLTWVVIVDGSLGRVLEYAGPTKKLVVKKEMHQPLVSSVDIVGLKRGRSFHSFSNNRSAMEFRTDALKNAKKKFLEKMIEFLKGNTQKFQQLILVAPPEALGILRKFTTQSLERKICNELNKDLTHTPINDLPKHLDSILHFKV